MTKDEFLKSVAEAGYNVGFGAKKHFATYDIVEKIPGLINFFSMAFGIYALVCKQLSNDILSASLVVLGIISMYISYYDPKKLEYEQSGIKLTQIYNNLALLYRKAKSGNDADVPILLSELALLQSQYYTVSQTKQILFSDWYAHYKFFWQHQIEWVDEQKRFSLFRDKIPLSFYFFCVVFLIVLISYHYEKISNFCIAISH